MKFPSNIQSMRSFALVYSYYINPCTTKRDCSRFQSILLADQITAIAMSI